MRFTNFLQYWNEVCSVTGWKERSCFYKSFWLWAHQTVECLPKKLEGILHGDTEQSIIAAWKALSSGSHQNERNGRKCGSEGTNVFWTFIELENATWRGIVKSGTHPTFKSWLATLHLSTSSLNCWDSFLARGRKTRMTYYKHCTTANQINRIPWPMHWSLWNYQKWFQNGQGPEIIKKRTMAIGMKGGGIKGNRKERSPEKHT